jgi:2-octaprenyl-6-methoxyphenol hydroxylase
MYQHMTDAASADIIVCGGSYAGMAMALALAAELGPQLRLVLADRAAAGPSRPDDPRATALSAASVNLLTKLGLWRQLETHAQPVATIALTDSGLDAGVRPVQLTYDNVTADGVPASWIVPNRELGAVLAGALASCGPLRRAQGEIVGLEVGDFAATLALADGRRLAGALVIAADGRASGLRALAGIPTIGTRAAAQVGIVTTIRHTADHGGRAIQHFLPGGPFALLPLKGGHTTCVTWSEERGRAEAILRLPDADFLAEIDTRAAGALGDLQLAGPRQSWPLESVMARSFTGPRLALIGDAAHSVHPIAGQGLNLAFRDVAALAECVADAALAGGDLGTAAVLGAYERWRRFDSSMAIAGFDGLNRLFSNDVGVVRSLRGAGLSAIDRLPFVKQRLVAEAAGLTGTLPRLLRPPARRLDHAASQT